MATGQGEARLHGCQRSITAQYQPVLGKCQHDGQENARNKKHRQPQHDQQCADCREQGELGPQIDGQCQQVAVARAFAPAAGIEKQDQGAGVQRIEQQPDNQAVAGRRIRAHGVVNDVLQHGFKDDQRQAQHHDLAQIALEEVQGVANNGQRIHWQLSAVKSGAPL